MRVDALTKEVTLTEAEYHDLTDGPRIHGWVARDNCGGSNLSFFTKKPERSTGCYYSYPEDDEPSFWSNCYGRKYELPSDLFPEITWDSDPVEVELLIRKP